MKTCCIDGCDKRHFGRGWCEMHYRRWYETKTTTPNVKETTHCSIDGCEEFAYGRGWCRLHWDRWYRTGDPLMVRTTYRAKNLPKQPPLMERFWARVNKNGPIPTSCPERGPCYLWTGAIAGNGYGRMTQDGKRKAAHRVSYEQLVRPITEGMFVCHYCDVPLCVRPEHLFLGTPLDNIRDASKKGRMHPGEKNWGAKLTTDEVRRIRELFAAGGIEQKALARQYGVSPMTISLLVRGKHWAHVH